MKKIYSLAVAVALAFTVQAQQSHNYVFADQGFANAEDITTGNILSGKLTYEALANGSNNPPKYYDTGKNMRLYSSNGDGNGNSYEIKAVGDVKINSVRFVTDDYSDYAPMTAKLFVDGNVVPTVKDPADASIYVVEASTPASSIKIQNGQTGTSAQIRIQVLEITYSDNLSTIDYETAAKAVKTTVWTDTASFDANGVTNVEVYNINGQLVKTYIVNGKQNVNVSSLAKGVYLVKTTTNGVSATTKVVKK